MTGPNNPALWEIRIYSGVKKRLARMPKQEQKRILDAVHGLRDNPFEHDLKALRGRPLWRLRVGGWRVLLRIDREKRIFYAVSVRTRGDVYK